MVECLPYGGAVICHRQFFTSFCAGAATLSEQLQRETARYRAETFAENTEKTYQTHLNSYLRFSELLDILNQCRRQKKTVAQYAAYLPRRLKPSSVTQYLNSINIVISWSQTIQRREKTLPIHLPVLLGHPLCPVSPVRTMFRAIGPSGPKSQAFPIRGSHFNRRLRADRCWSRGRLYQPQFWKGRDYLGRVLWSARRNSQGHGGLA